MIGKTLGHYEISEKLGSGGMGDVYRARDTKLGRNVAVKILPETFSENQERRARFGREARLLANLNHPNIATLYDLEECDGVHFLVLELVPGETLAEKIKRGPIDIDDALELFKQMAEALDSAHEKGIIHRDLKPSNVKVTPEGKVKVLDFGLAKALVGECAERELSESPTITRQSTGTGVLLGTAPYMSPEQVRCKDIDKRADIWAFGCCLYEALTGRPAFLGETVSDTIALILERDVDWTDLPEFTPPSIPALLRRCLQKDSHRRWRDMWDLRVELERAQAEPLALTETNSPLSGKKRKPAFWLGGVAGVTIGAVAASVVVWNLAQPTTSEQRGTTRFNINVPPEAPLARDTPGVAISPDGMTLVYAAGAGETSQLYIRQMDQLEAVPIPGSEGAQIPFISPESRWVGFFAAGKLKKVPLSGGTPVTICDAREGYGGSWGSDNHIVFADRATIELLRVPANGGTPEVLADLKSEPGVVGFAWPEVLPGCESVLYTIYSGGSVDDFKIAVLSMGTGKSRVLVEQAGYARYASTGHLVYARGRSILATPFDIHRLELSGPPVLLFEGVRSVGRGGVNLSLSPQGALAFVPAQDPSFNAPIWVDRQGETEPIQVPKNWYWLPSFSPDGRRLAITTIRRPVMETWILEIARGALTRFTFEGSNHFTVWTPDGRRLTFSSNREGAPNLFWKPADGSGEAERLTVSEHHQDPASWTSDGRVLAFTEAHPETRWDIWLLHVEDELRAEPFLCTEFNETHPMISPDGRWLAYVSNESGLDEVYVQPFPDGGRKWLISTEGGDEPLWRPDGRELFYRDNDKLMVVAVETESEFATEKPRMLFETPTLVGSGFGSPNYDITPDGSRFLMIQPGPRPPATEIRVVLNWFDELERLVPTN